jgi:hypothetical protein
MRQDILGATFVAAVCGVVVLATYRPEKGEGRFKIFATLIVAMLFAFLTSLAVLCAFFAYSSAEMNIIRSPPDF